MSSSSSTPTLNLRPVSSSSTGKKRKIGKKTVPSGSSLNPWDFSYSPSGDGNDLNLLMMFHGVGDSKTPFFNLGKSFNLPCTAILSLSAPDPIPLMDHPSYSWYPTLTPDYFPLPLSSQNPTKHIDRLRNLLKTLTSDEIGWDLEDIHLFGWGQGGTMALELGLDIGRNPLSQVEELEPGSKDDVDGQNGNGKVGKRLGSIISISSTLLTHLSSNSNLATPILYFTRHSPSSAIHKKSLMVLQRAYREVIVVTPPSKANNAGGSASGNIEDMPRGKEEWFPIMKFWSQVLNRKQEGWKGSGEIYEVVQ